MGHAYVVIPEDVDREEYINDCYSLKSVAIQTDELGVITKVLVGKQDMKDIEFPDTAEELGSMVLFVSIPGSNRYSILKVYEVHDYVSPDREHMYSFSAKLEEKAAFIGVDGANGAVSISSQNGKGIDVSAVGDEADLNMNAGRSMKAESIDVTITGYNSINFRVPNNGGDDTIIKYTSGEGFSYFDEYENAILLNEEMAQVKSKKINLGDGAEPLILGQKLVDFLDKFITQVSAITTTTALGAMPILNKVTVEALKKDLDALKSKLSNTD
jgi:hypothetical protein